MESMIKNPTMFMSNEERLQQVEDYLDHLYKTVGLRLNTYVEVKMAIRKERSRLKRL